MTEKNKKPKTQVFIDADLAQQIKDNFADNDTTSVSWVLSQLGQRLVRGMISLNAINPLKDNTTK